MTDVATILTGRHILLVEDDFFNRQVATALLEFAGADVQSAKHGKEALDILQCERVDCVLMDMQMPIMDGLEATRRIRQDARHAQLPIIAMTASGQPDDRKRCFDAGMNDFLAKPAHAELIYDTIARHVATRVNPSFNANPSASAGQAKKTPAVPVAASEQARTDYHGQAINLQFLADLLGHNPEKTKKYALRFLDVMQQSLEEIVRANQRQDFVVLRFLGHRSKSSARAVGAGGLADLCQLLEQYAGEADVQQSQQTIVRMQTVVQRIRRELAEAFGS